MLGSCGYFVAHPTNHVSISGILCGIFSDSLSGILPGISSDILSGILSAISSEILTKTFGEERACTEILMQRAEVQEQMELKRRSRQGREILT